MGLTKENERGKIIRKIYGPMNVGGGGGVQRRIRTNAEAQEL
jgi:hypothetical protein